MKPIRAHNFFPEEVFTFISDRRVDFCLRDETRSFTQKQKEYLAGCLPREAQIVAVRQVHGADIWVVDNTDDKSEDWPEADGMLTNLPRIALSIRTADCLPIFVYDPHQRCIGLIHAGWKGSRQKIAQQAIRLMQDRYRSRASDIRAYLGPGIRACCYRVGQEFRNCFPDEIQEREGVNYLDLALVNKHQLAQAGLREQNIGISQVCTCCCKDFFSFRGEGESTGRHLSLIMLQD